MHISVLVEVITITAMNRLLRMLVLAIVRLLAVDSKVDAIGRDIVTFLKLIRHRQSLRGRH